MYYIHEYVCVCVRIYTHTHARHHIVGATRHFVIRSLHVWCVH